MGVGTRTSTADLEAAMAAAPILQHTSPEAVAGLVGAGRIRQYRRGTYLFHQGDDSHELFFLWRGRVEVSSLSSTGHRILHTTLDSPQFFGELGVLGELPRTATAVALEDTSAWLVRDHLFLEFLAGHPEATRELMRALAAQILANESFVEDLLYLDLKGRVAKRLLQLVTPSLARLPPDGSVVPSVVTHADLASLCGGSRENVTRILSEFQRRGLVLKDGRRYRLNNVAGLSRLAGL
jgi:CRP/FNR family transcriptional regulator, cyclic AMP receptor protein